jgi:type IV secretion system protein VirB10
MKLAPLGRLDPPTPPPAPPAVVQVSTSDVLGPAPPPPQAVGVGPQGNPQPGHPHKTPAQLALERKLSEPVVKRGPFAGRARRRAAGPA